jgi:hypothetical protein
MANGVAQITEQELREHRHAAELAFGGALFSGIAGIGAGVLSILGLANMLPGLLVSVATIGIGAALISEGLAIGARTSDLLRESTQGAVEIGELGVGVTSETLAGLAGVVLGILSLLNLYPMILVASAAIVFGGALVLGGGAMARINVSDVMQRQGHPVVHAIAREAVYATTGLQMIAGLGTITLGVLAIAGMAPLTLLLVAMLTLSGMFLLTNTALATRMLGAWRYQQQ